jgi:hypothetical protein
MSRVCERERERKRERQHGGELFGLGRVKGKVGQ